MRNAAIGIALLVVLTQTLTAAAEGATSARGSRDSVLASRERTSRDMTSAHPLQHTYIVDDLDEVIVFPCFNPPCPTTGFELAGPAAGWFSSGSSDLTYQGHAYYTYAANRMSPGVNNVGAWWPSEFPDLDVEFWEILAYVPRVVTGRPDTSSARYMIHLDGRVVERELDQSSGYGWRSLGVFPNGQDIPHVELSDVTADAGQGGTTVLFDAMKWVPVSQMADAIDVYLDGRADGAIVRPGEPVRFCYAVGRPSYVRLQYCEPSGCRDVVIGFDDGTGACYSSTTSPPDGERTIRGQILVDGVAIAEDVSWFLVESDAVPTPTPLPVEPTSTPGPSGPSKVSVDVVTGCDREYFVGDVLDVEVKSGGAQEPASVLMYPMRETVGTGVVSADAPLRIQLPVEGAVGTRYLEAVLDRSGVRSSPCGFRVSNAPKPQPTAGSATVSVRLAEGCDTMYFVGEQVDIELTTDRAGSVEILRRPDNLLIDTRTVSSGVFVTLPYTVTRPIGRQSIVAILDAGIAVSPECWYSVGVIPTPTSIAPWLPKVYLPMVINGGDPKGRCLDVEVEPNNTQNQALGHDPLCSNSAVVGILPSGDSNDWYRIVIDVDGWVDLVLSSIADEDSYDVDLYRLDGTIIDSQKSRTATTVRLLRFLPAGEYGVRVNTEGFHSSQPYRLRWSSE